MEEIFLRVLNYFSNNLNRGFRFYYLYSKGCTRREGIKF